jgi:hypothetical protein
MQRELFFILMDDRYLPNGKTTAKRKNQGMRFQFYSVTSDQLEELAKDIIEPSLRSIRKAISSVQIRNKLVR